jgi:hypothetical protein
LLSDQHQEIHLHPRTDLLLCATPLEPNMVHQHESVHTKRLYLANLRDKPLSFYFLSLYCSHLARRILLPSYQKQFLLAHVFNKLLTFPTNFLITLYSIEFFCRQRPSLVLLHISVFQR